ncbi:MBL fold metallo-hydrolase RNA specificity domain-containing protein [Alkalimarinus alittae]|uniref:MBL fold metallo-hydrolase n=1 Tax=Alkalimarinus alittae TaxID=2961619 RepID=A0ABY6MZC4_9ALTE|nr:MBL fold metallo-hydrolase [Alkalimarinus alittae]UZE95145.1 MBL fold metallo-hydrolase [Alkalimarinus alittae]
MEILHHGAVNGVTGSCHELKLNDNAGILIDCGLFQGAETSGKGATENSLEIDFPIEHIKALVVTHVHIDHLGRIPYLLAAGFNGPIICSEPTAALLPLVLEDALKVGFTRNKQLITRFIKEIKQKIIALPFGEWHSVISGLDVKLKPAGHILGSAYVVCRVKTTQKAKKVIFSGDLGAPYSPLLTAPKAPYGCDVLVIESTYGDKEHTNRKERKQQLQAVIEKAVKDRGVILIPAFSIGRTQELLYELESLIYQNSRDEHRKKYLTERLAWDDIEIVIDSPLAAKFTEVYRTLEPYWDKEARKRVVSGRHPLSFDQLTTIDDHDTHIKTVEYLKKTARPTIVIAASGMCAGGRILNYLKALLADQRTDVLFVGYQAKGTPGHDIQQYGSKGGYVMIEGEKYPINAQIHTISGYSAHADQKNLTDFVKRMKKKPQEIRIIHGDNDAKSALKAKYRTLLGEEVNIKIPSAD